MNRMTVETRRAVAMVKGAVVNASKEGFKAAGARIVDKVVMGRASDEELRMVAKIAKKAGLEMEMAMFAIV